MMQTVQLSIADSQYAATVREALSRSCAWHVEAVERPDLSRHCVMVLDEQAFERLPLPLSNPERIVLVARKEPQFLAQAWEAGIVSVVSEEDPLSTVLLAIMAAALRVAKTHHLRRFKWNNPHFRIRICANSPTSSNIPAQNVAKSNSLAVCRSWSSACTTFHSEKEIPPWTAL